jgi:hypothetical protein
MMAVGKVKPGSSVGLVEDPEARSLVYIYMVVQGGDIYIYMVYIYIYMVVQGGDM